MQYFKNILRQFEKYNIIYLFYNNISKYIQRIYFTIMYGNLTKYILIIVLLSIEFNNYLYIIISL